MGLFYSPVRFSDATIFDPFMGSGTTIVETLKLGARAVGKDINPVAHFLVRNAVAKHRRHDVEQTFRGIEIDVARELQSLYMAQLPNGELVPVLYYFWVKQLDCPACSAVVDLFSSRIFARHAYSRKFPAAQACCPACGGINVVNVDAREANCSSCGINFDPSLGTTKGQMACCPACAHEFSIARTIRMGSEPPRHRLYAKLVLLPDGTKRYLPADKFDEELYSRAESRLRGIPDAFPVASIEPGHNTNQALNYNYRRWHQFFNERQLLGLHILGERIKAIPNPGMRELFACLFSGTLEFNNIFASYKGEGTGAVRHMFSHHILKPERMPLEANLWGTPKSSGAFSTLFSSRILRALDYAEEPFELRTSSKDSASEKVYGHSGAVGVEIASSNEAFLENKRAYLSCGDSSTTDLGEGSVDVVITDPPFFDNVNYSQLADFFYVWQRHILDRDGCAPDATTRSEGEVQHGQADIFQDRLAGVWRECHRVLKEDGLLVFSYHHSRTEGWGAVLAALMSAGFGIVATHPVKAEMSVAKPKLQAKEPIDLDILIVCRKLAKLPRQEFLDASWSGAIHDATLQVERFRDAGRPLSRNDVRIIFMGQLLKSLSTAPSSSHAMAFLDSVQSEIEEVISSLHDICERRRA
ncbi:MAG TPA: DNA methyltransferase [Devosia sp.]